MANQRRSVWEIRFLALKEYISAERTRKKQIAGHAAIFNMNGLTKENREKFKTEIFQIDQITDRMEKIENSSANDIWLNRDY